MVRLTRHERLARRTRARARAIRSGRSVHPRRPTAPWPRLSSEQQHAGLQAAAAAARTPRAVRARVGSRSVTRASPAGRRQARRGDGRSSGSRAASRLRDRRRWAQESGAGAGRPSSPVERPRSSAHSLIAPIASAAPLAHTTQSSRLLYSSVHSYRFRCDRSGPVPLTCERFALLSSPLFPPRSASSGASQVHSTRLDGRRPQVRLAPYNTRTIQ